MHIATAVLAALLCLPAASARALTVEEIVNLNVAARGGSQKLSAIQSLRLTGKMIFSFGDNQIETAWGRVIKRPGMIRTDVTLQGLTAVDAYDATDS